MTREASRQRRDDILRVAIDLFRSKGLAATATRDVTDALGIARSHIYHYFPDWQSLCHAALLQFMDNDLAQAQQELAACTPPEALTVLTGWFIPERIDADWRLYSDIWQAGMRDEAWREPILANARRWDSLIESIIEKGCRDGWYQPVNAARAARQIGALVNGYADMMVLDSGEAQRQTALADIQALLDLLLRPGAAASGEALSR